MKTAKAIMFLIIGASLMMSFASPAKKWDFLGERSVNFKLDKDEISVTAKEGVFKKIKLQVRKAPVHFRKVVVHYRNGTSETIALRDKIRAGGETRAIDLNGNKRIIKKVVFFYNTKVKAPQKGKVMLFGLH